MSLTPPPPPPPHRPSSLLPSGCKTPILNPGARRLSTATVASSSDSVPSPNQLRQILADITKQVTNSPQSRLPSTAALHRHNDRHASLNTLMRPSHRQAGPVTRSRSMLRHITPRSSITPRGTRANTPVRDENLQSNPLVIQTPRTPFNLSNSPSSRSIVANGSPGSTQGSSNRHPIAPLRYRALSSVSSVTTSLSSPTTITTAANSSDQPSPHPTPSSSTSSNLRSSLRFGGSHRSSPTPPLTPSSSSNSQATSIHSDNTHIQLPSLRERRSLDQVESPSSQQNLCCENKPSHSPSSGSLAKRRRRNPSGLGRL